MKTIIIKGRFSYIDKYNNLKFVWIDEKSKNKISSYLQHSKGKKPYNNEGFTIKGKKDITIEITSKVGFDCTVEIKLVPYSFKLKDKEVITGHSLYLLYIA
jgi:hypothetical protein